MKRGLWIGILLLCSTSAAYAQGSERMDKAVQAVCQADGMAAASVSVCVYDAVQGKPLYAHDAQRGLPAASAQKVLTTGVALDRMGADFRFTTRLLMQGEVDRDGVLQGDLIIVGGGDPLLGSYRYRQTSMDSLFAQWLEALRARGVRRVAGRIGYDAHLFADAGRHDTWQHGDVGNYYGAGASALTFHENMYFVHFNAGQQVGDAAHVVRTVPKNMSLVEDCRVRTGQAGSGDGVVVYGLEDSRERLYMGTVPLGARDFAVRAALPCPPRTCADLLAAYLRQHGISITHDATPVVAPTEGVRTVSEYRSPKLQLIAQYTNHTSNNVYAECIFKYLGHAHGGEGSFEGGRKAVEQWLDERGVARKGISIIDGSGLSRSNVMTADFLCRYLAAISQRPIFAQFLPTLRTGKPATVRYKSGSMTGLRSQVGYVSHGQRRTAYCIILYNYSCAGQQASAYVDSLVQAIAESF